MAQGVLKFSDLSVPLIVARTREIVDAMTDNVNFATPNPSLALVTASVDLLEKKYNASRRKGKALTDAMILQLKSHRALMVKVLAYVQQESGGDSIKIQSASIEVKGAPTPKPALGKIQNLRGNVSNIIGVTDLAWQSEKDARTYVIQISPDSIVWVDRKESPTRADVAITGLVPESFSYYRVAGVNAAGRGAYSNPVRVGAG